MLRNNYEQKGFVRLDLVELLEQSKTRVYGEKKLWFYDIDEEETNEQQALEVMGG